MRLRHPAAGVAALVLCAAATPLRAQRLSDTLAIQEQVLPVVRRQLDSVPGIGRVVLDPASSGLAHRTAAERQRLGAILRAATPDSADRTSCLLRARPPCSPAGWRIISGIASSHGD